MKATMCDCDVIHENIVNKVKNKLPYEKEFKSVSNLYKIYSDRTRLKIIYALYINEMCVCDLASLLNMTKSAISHQLGFLKNNFLVKSRKSGKIVYYSLSDNCSKEILKFGFKHVNENNVRDKDYEK